MPTTDERLKQLEEHDRQRDAQQALQTEALRRILEGKWTGADGAAGLVVALEGGQTNIQVLDLPKSAAP